MGKLFRKERNNILNFEKSNVDLYDISIVQDEVGGGTTGSGQIDVIREHQNAKSLIVSGLDQEAFEYLIENYGKQFEVISLWKNKLISDLSPLGSLRGLKYLHFFFNQRVTDLWDMRGNVNLKGVAIYDFSRLHTIDRIETAPCLEHFSVGDRVWPRMEIESLKPRVHSSVSHFSWRGKGVLDNDYECLVQSNIKELDLPVGQFNLDRLARLNAEIPGLKGRASKPYYESSMITHHDGEKIYYCLCKGRKRLEKGRDEEKLERYLEEFNGLIEKYKSELQ